MKGHNLDEVYLMDILPTEKSVHNDEGKESANGLGISKGIYALGQSAKEGLVWGLAVTAAVTAVLFWGRKDGNAIDKAALWIEKLHDKIKNHFGVQKSARFTSAFAVASIVGGLVAHIAQGPGFAFGWKKVNAAIDTYDSLAQEKARVDAENTQLKSQYALAKSDNERLNAALAEAQGKRPSAVERLAENQAQTQASAMSV